MVPKMATDTLVTGLHTQMVYTNLGTLSIQVLLLSAHAYPKDILPYFVNVKVQKVQLH